MRFIKNAILSVLVLFLPILKLVSVLFGLLYKASIIILVLTAGTEIINGTATPDRYAFYVKLVIIAIVSRFIASIPARIQYKYVYRDE